MSGINIYKCYVAIDSFSGDGVDPHIMMWEEEDIEEYLKSHPMPNDPNYSKEDMIGDLTSSVGTLTFSEDLKPETIEFLEGLMSWLLDKPGLVEEG